MSPATAHLSAPGTLSEQTVLRDGFRRASRVVERDAAPAQCVEVGEHERIGRSFRRIPGHAFGFGFGFSVDLNQRDRSDEADGRQAVGSCLLYTSPSPRDRG